MARPKPNVTCWERVTYAVSDSGVHSQSSVLLGFGYVLDYIREFAQVCRNLVLVVV